MITNATTSKARKGQGHQGWGWAAAVCSCWLPKGKFVGSGGLSLGAGSEESLPALTVGPLHSPCL